MRPTISASATESRLLSASSLTPCACPPLIDGVCRPAAAVWPRVYDRSILFPLRILVAWAVDAAALAVAAWIFRGISVGGSAGTLILAALVYGLLASFVKPALKLLTLPLAIVTLGVAWFFVAMFILWLTDVIVGGLHIRGFWTLVGGTVVVWAVGAAADRWLFPKRGPLKRMIATSSRFTRA